MKILHSFYKGFALILSKIFGKFSWHSPPWLIRTRSLFRLHPWRWTAVLLLILVTGSAYFYWSQHHSKRVLITAQIYPPVSVRDLLVVDFADASQDLCSQVSVAPIEQFDKSLLAGIKMVPEMQGGWKWQADRTLIFTPAADWPAGQKYQIAFNKAVFDQTVNMQSYRYAFSTAPLAIEAYNLRVYQDLMNPQLQKIVGTLYFNFPVDEKSLLECTHLIMQEASNDQLDLAAESIPLTINYESNTKAYIESAPVKLPALPRFVNLMIDRGVRANEGPASSKEVVTEKLLLPDFSSFLQVKDLSASIEHDREDNPEQVLYLETTVGISSDELLKYLQVFILPNDYPAVPFHPVRKDYPWSKPGEVTQEVLALAKPVHLEPFPEEHAFPTVHRFKLQAAAPSCLYIQLAKGVPGVGGFFLKNDYKTVVQTPDYAQEIHFLHTGSLLAKSGGKNISVAVRGIPEVKFSICHILPQFVNHLVTQTYGDFHKPQFRYGFGCEAISQIFSDRRQFHVTSPCDLKYTSIDLEQYLKSDQDSLGLFVLKAQGWDAKNSAPTDVESDRLILITDMDLLVKDNADETHDLFVQSITEGLPVAGASVALLGKNSLPLIEAETDADGHVKFPNMQDFKDDREPAVYVVRNGGDLSFIPYHRRDRILNYSRFNTDGVVSLPESNLNAYVFLDRGVYRPGDLLHIGTIVKNQFAQDPEPGLPLEVVLKDPQGAALFAQKISLPASHLITIDYTLPEQAAIGKYSIHLYAVKDDKQLNLLGFTSFMVGEFLPDRLKMEAHFMSEAASHWVSPIGQKATISLWNLFGAPAANHAVKAKMVLTPNRALSFPQYENYCFKDPLPKPDSKFTFSEEFTDVVTDDTGYLELPLNLERFSNATYQLDFFAEGFEAGGGRGVSTALSTLVTPHPFLIGYKACEGLHFLKQHSQASIRFIAINPELESLAVDHLQAQLVSIKTVSTLVKKLDGTYQYQDKRQKIVEAEYPFEIGVDGSDFMLPTDRVGDFALALKNAEGNLLSKLYFSVGGESPIPASKKRELSVALDKQVYQGGDTIEMQINAPYSGAGLLTIEREKVYAYKWFKTDASTSVQTIEIPPDFQGNGYVNVAFVRAWDSDEVYINPLSYAVVPFTVSNASQTLHIDLDAPEFVRAGECLTIQFSTDQPAKVVLFAIDEGILQVDGYQTPDPLSYFFRKSALEVETSQIADLILPKQRGGLELSATGGDKQAKLAAMGFNPFKRKTEKATAFWFDILDSDAIPKTVSCHMPDYFNGSLRIMAVAVGSNKVGNAEKNTRVQSYFTIHPNAPTFLAPGDKATVTAAITNSMENEEEMLVTLEASPQLAIVGSSEHSILIPTGQERQVSFQIKAVENLGAAELTFTAKQGNKTSQVHSTLTVRPSAAYQTHLISGYENGSSKTIHPARKLYPEHAILEAAASTSPVILANGLQSYLENFPHASTEQLVCRSFAQLAMAKDSFFQLDSQKVDGKFKEALQLLRERQLPSGGFSNWPGRYSTEASLHASVLAMDYLTEARLDGYHVPDDVFNIGIHYLENFAKQSVEDLSEARMQAHAIYLLTRNGLVTTNYLTNLLLYLTTHQKNVWQKDLTSAYIAATHQLLQSSQQADLLIGSYQLDCLMDDAQYMRLLARHFPERLKKIGNDAVLAIVEGIAGDQLNTLSAAYSIQALTAFSGLRSDSSLQIHEMGEGNKEKPLASLNTSYPKVHFEPDAKELRFYNPAKEPYYYQVNQTGFDKDHGQLKKNGLEVFREYRDNRGQALQSTQLGNKIEAHIKARTLNQPSVTHVAIVDLFPGGFDLVPNSIEAPVCDYVEVREDRIIFYCSLMTSPLELSYRLQAVNKGEYTVPPLFAQALYRPQVQGQGAASQINVR